jgi:hypothetical protein
MALNSRQKGKRGELEACKTLRNLFGWSTRRSQQHCGTVESADIQVRETPGLWWEVKRVQSLNIPKAVATAVSQCGGRLPVLLHRRNDHEWLVTIRLSDVQKFSREIEGASRDG